MSQLKLLIRDIEFFIIALLLFSCNYSKKESSKIEIYLLKDTILTKEGVEISNMPNKEDLDSTYYNKIDTIRVRYDTLNKEFIYAGRFNAEKSELKDKPFITNDEIIGLNLTESVFIFTQPAAKKIVNIQSSMKYGKQFAILKDGNILLTGYFWSKSSSYGSTWYCIEYDRTQNISKRNEFSFYKGNGINAMKREKIEKDMPHIGELVNAFEKSDRLISEN